MADPLTVVGAVAASSQVAEQLVRATFGIVELVSKLREAPESIRKQIIHVEQMMNIAELITHNPALRVSSVTSVLTTCLREIQELDTLLRKAEVTKNMNDFAKFSKALKSVLKSKEVGDRFERLEREKASLMLCIHQIDSRALLKIGIQIEILKDKLGTISSVVKDSSRNITTLINSIQPISTTLQNVEASLPTIASNVRTVFDEIPAMSKMLSDIQQKLQLLKLDDSRVEDQKAKDDVSSRTYFDVPNRRIRPFFGRQDVLLDIDKAFSSGSTEQIVVLQGMGGQGKSSVALEYCHLRKGDPFAAIFWTNATSKNSLEKSFESIYDSITRGKGDSLDTQGKVAFVTRELSSWSIRWLLVFDNYDEPSKFPTIQDYFPHSTSGAILVTSRHAGTDSLTLEVDSGFIKVKGLDEDAAAALLMQQSQSKKSAEETEVAKSIARRLGCHALAIAQAGSYIRKRRISLGDFLNHYRHRKKAILTNTPQISQYTRLLGDDEKETSLNVFTTWDLSFNQLQYQPNGDLAAKLLNLLAFFDSTDILEDFFIRFYNESIEEDQLAETTWLTEFANANEEWDSDLFADVLLCLEDLCLLQHFKDDDEDSYHMSLHPLIKDWIRLRIDDQACEANALASAVVLETFMSSFSVNGHFKMPIKLKQVLSLHVLCQEDNYADFIRLRVTQLDKSKIGLYLNAQLWFGVLMRDVGLINVAEEIVQHVANDCEQVLGGEHRATLDTKSLLATVCSHQSSWAEAEKLNVEVLEYHTRHHGSEHPRTLAAMTNLAFTYQEQGRLKDAEELMLIRIEITRRVLGDEHLDTLDSMGNLAALYNIQGRSTEAEELILRIIEPINRIFGEDHPDTLAAQYIYALSLDGNGRTVEAVRVMEDVIRLESVVYGPEHPDTATCQSWLNEWKGKLAEESSYSEV